MRAVKVVVWVGGYLRARFSKFFFQSVLSVSMAVLLFSALCLLTIAVLLFCAHYCYRYMVRKPTGCVMQMEQVKTCRVMIDNRWYDLAKYLNTFSHPGGNKIIQQYDGMDCSQVFHSLHPNHSTEILDMILPKYLVADTDDDAFKSTVPCNDNVDYYNNDEYFRKSPKLAAISRIFVEKVNHTDFPCVCGKTSIQSKQTKFAIIDDINYDLNDLPFILLNYMLQQQSKWKLKPKRFMSTLVIFFTNIQDCITEKAQFERYILQCFEILANFQSEELHKQQIDAIEPDSKMYPLYKSTFRFCSRTFFVAPMCRFDTRAYRNFAVPSLVINSVEEFDFIGSEFDMIHKIIAKRMRNYRI